MTASRIGSTLDSMFAEVGQLEEVDLRAQRKSLAHVVRRRMPLLRISKSALAVRMCTSPTVVDRLRCRLTIGLTQAD